MVKDMTKGNPLKLMLFFSIPVLAGNIFQQFYNMVDAVIVGQFLGAEALGAVGSVSSLMFLIIGFANGITQGFGVAVSHAFGEKNYDMLRHYVALSLVLIVVFSVVLSVPTFFYCRELLEWLNTPSDIIQMAQDYLEVIFAGIIFTMAYNVAAGILRGVGDSKTPLYFLLFASVLNIFLDLFMIIVLKMGTAGAAYATIISQGISALLCFIYMFWKFQILRIGRTDFYFDSISIKNMLSIGVPMALNYSITSFGMIAIQAAVNGFGSAVVAAFAAAAKVFNLGLQMPYAIGTTMATYCGQNLGAKESERIFTGVRYGFLLSFVIATIFAIGCIAGGPFAIHMFINNPSEEIIYYAMHYLKIIVWFYVPLTWILVYRNALQGLDEGVVPMLTGFVEFVVR